MHQEGTQMKGRKDTHMFDNEQLSQRTSRPEYDERYRAERPPSYGGMGEKMVTPKHFWTRTKIISAVVVVVVLIGGIVCISQSIAIQQRQYDIQGKIGNV